MNQWRTGLRFTVLTLALVLLFQNCSDIKVSQLPLMAPPSPPVVANSKPLADICNPQGAVYGAPIRIVLMIDMSISNIGRVENDGENLRNWSLDTSAGPADLNGLRFRAVRDFISECGNGNVKYAVLGFSTSSQFVRGHTCISPFESQSEAIRTVNTMADQQAADKAQPYRDSVQYPFNLGINTNYTAAVDCIESKVNEDMALLGNEKPVYYTYLITDGQPTDTNPQFLQIIKNKIQNLAQMASSIASGLHFQTVFYTSPGAQNGPPQQDNAISILNELTRVTEGPSGNTIFVNNLLTAQQQLCSTLQPNIRVNYALKEIYAVNVNSKLKRNNSLKDTDGDGLADEEEQTYGSSAGNPRTSGVLDSLCFRSGLTLQACQARVAQLSCTPANVALKFSDCDRAFSRWLYGREINNFDADADLIPNYIELIRGTSMVRFDSNDNPTSDGVTNLRKIGRGLDVLSSLDLWPVPEKSEMKLTFNQQDTSCENDLNKYRYVIDNVPVSAVSAYTDNSSDQITNFSHAENENVVLVFSMWQSNGGVALPNRLYMQKWLVPLVGSPRMEENKFIGEF